jgi:transcriptional regulator of acetoin/glycerol metabolism
MTLEEIRNQAEKAHIHEILKNVDGNVSEAARQLDVSRITLYRLMAKHDIHPHLLRAA